MLRGQAKVDPGQGFSGSDSQDKSKPETEPKNGNHFGIDRCGGRSFCSRGSETNLAVRERQQNAKRRQAFLGIGITAWFLYQLRLKDSGVWSRFISAASLGVR